MSALSGKRPRASSSSKPAPASASGTASVTPAKRATSSASPPAASAPPVMIPQRIPIAMPGTVSSSIWRRPRCSHGAAPGARTVAGAMCPSAPGIIPMSETPYLMTLYMIAVR